MPQHCRFALRWNHHQSNAVSLFVHLLELSEETFMIRSLGLLVLCPSRL